MFGVNTRELFSVDIMTGNLIIKKIEIRGISCWHCLVGTLFHDFCLKAPAVCPWLVSCSTSLFIWLCLWFPGQSSACQVLSFKDWHWHAPLISYDEKEHLFCLTMIIINNSLKKTGYYFWPWQVSAKYDVSRTFQKRACYRLSAAHRRVKQRTSLRWCAQSKTVKATPPTHSCPVAACCSCCCFNPTETALCVV